MLGTFYVYLEGNDSRTKVHSCMVSSKREASISAIAELTEKEKDFVVVNVEYVENVESVIKYKNTIDKEEILKV